MHFDMDNCGLNFPSLSWVNLINKRWRPKSEGFIACFSPLKKYHQLIYLIWPPPKALNDAYLRMPLPSLIYAHHSVCPSLHISPSPLSSKNQTAIRGAIPRWKIDWRQSLSLSVSLAFFSLARWFWAFSCIRAEEANVRGLFPRGNRGERIVRDSRVKRFFFASSFSPVARFLHL